MRMNASAKTRNRELAVFVVSRRARLSPGDVGLPTGTRRRVRSFAALIDCLQQHSAEFRALWAEHRVLQQSDSEKILDHPIAGRIVLDHTTLTLPGCPDTMVQTYTARAGSDSERALHALLA